MHCLLLVELWLINAGPAAVGLNPVPEASYFFGGDATMHFISIHSLQSVVWSHLRLINHSGLEAQMWCATEATMLRVKHVPLAVTPMLKLLVLTTLQIKDMEALMDNQAAWGALSRREQQEKEGVLRQESECACMLHAGKHVGQDSLGNFCLLVFVNLTNYRPMCA